MNDTSSVAVIGGGYAGLFAARRAAQLLKGHDARVVLVDPDADWHERTRWHQLAAGETVQPHSRAALFRGTDVDVVTATVADIDLDNRRLELDGSPGAVSFGQLVCTTGSESVPRSVDGVSEHAFTLDSAASSRAIAAAIDSRPDARVVVVGGGLTGIQLAAQIADNHHRVTVTLVSSGRVGSEFPEATRPQVVSALEGLGVTVLQDAPVTAVDATGTEGPHGHLDAEIVVWTAGFAPSSLAGRAGVDATENGQVIVDDVLRSSSHPFVFAAGDAATLPRAGSPYGAYAATGTGATAGKNAALSVLGRDLDRLDLGYAFLSASIGRRHGVVQFLHADGTPRDRVLAGRTAHWIKEQIERYVVGTLKAERHVPGLYRWSPGPRA